MEWLRGLIFNFGEKMKSIFTLIVVVLACLNITACGERDEYNATLAEGVQFAAKRGYPSFIKSVTGMSGYEAEGRWTEGKNVVFTFKENLPTAFTLELDVVGGFGPTAGNAIHILVGDWAGHPVVDSKPGIQKILVKTSVPTNKIEFVIPYATAPNDLGGHDSRLLGVMFKRLSILAAS